MVVDAGIEVRVRGANCKRGWEPEGVHGKKDAARGSGSLVVELVAPRSGIFDAGRSLVTHTTVPSLGVAMGDLQAGDGVFL